MRESPHGLAITPRGAWCEQIFVTDIKSMPIHTSHEFHHEWTNCHACISMAIRLLNSERMPIRAWCEWASRQRWCATVNWTTTNNVVKFYLSINLQPFCRPDSSSRTWASSTPGGLQLSGPKDTQCYKRSQSIISSLQISSRISLNFSDFCSFAPPPSVTPLPSDLAFVVKYLVCFHWNKTARENPFRVGMCCMCSLSTELQTRRSQDIITKKRTWIPCQQPIQAETSPHCSTVLWWLPLSLSKLSTRETSRARYTQSHCHQLVNRLNHC